MKIYLDDDLDWNALIGWLRRLGHEVISPRTAGTSGNDDADHLEPIFKPQPFSSK